MAATASRSIPGGEEGCWWWWTGRSLRLRKESDDGGMDAAGASPAPGIRTYEEGDPPNSGSCAGRAGFTVRPGAEKRGGSQIKTRQT